jgi:hypothetical protein
MIEIAKTASPNIEAVGTYWTMPHEVTLKKDGEQTILSVPSARVDSSMFSVFPFGGLRARHGNSPPARRLS